MKQNESTPLIKFYKKMKTMKKDFSKTGQAEQISFSNVNTIANEELKKKTNEFSAETDLLVGKQLKKGRKNIDSIQDKQGDSEEEQNLSSKLDGDECEDSETEDTVEDSEQEETAEESDGDVDELDFNLLEKQISDLQKVVEKEEALAKEEPNESQTDDSSKEESTKLASKKRKRRKSKKSGEAKVRKLNPELNLAGAFELSSDED